MSLFDRSMVDGDLFSSKPKGSFEEVPEGRYQAVIQKGELKKTKAGHRTVSLWIKTDKGMVFHSLNFDHPACAPITQKTVAQLMASYKNPPTKIDNFEHLLTLIAGLPVYIFVKHKSDGKLSVYFNEVPAERKLEMTQDGAPKKSVEY